MDAAVASAEERHRRELNTIKASAWANLAYLHLQQQQWQQAVANTQQLLKVGVELWVPQPTLNGSYSRFRV
jgi:hypothetical protein